MRIDVDMDRCESHGQCVFAAPGLFAFDEDDVLEFEPTASGPAEVAAARTAATACPARAITLTGG